AGVHAQPLVALERSGLLAKLGPQNALPDLRSALERARARMTRARAAATIRSGGKERVMGRFGRWLKPRFQDLAMRQMNDYRPATVERAEGDVLEIGFGTALNLRYYTAAVKSLAGVDPLEGLPAKIHERIAAAPFPVEHHALRADGNLPFDAGR